MAIQPNSFQLLVIQFLLTFTSNFHKLGVTIILRWIKTKARSLITSMTFLANVIFLAGCEQQTARTIEMKRCRSRVWSIVQAYNDPKVISSEEFETVLRGGLAGKSSRVMMFTTYAVAEGKTEVMKNVYTELMANPMK